MIRGLYLHISCDDSNLLSKIFKNIPVENFEWDIYNEQAWKSTGLELFEDRNYQGDEVEKIIQTPCKLIMLLWMYAYNGTPTNVYSYEDFVKSNCLFTLFVVDVYDIFIYCKDKSLLNQFIKNANQYNCQELEYITDENDTCTKFVRY